MSKIPTLVLFLMDRNINWQFLTK